MAKSFRLGQLIIILVRQECIYSRRIGKRNTPTRGSKHALWCYGTSNWQSCQCHGCYSTKERFHRASSSIPTETIGTAANATRRFRIQNMGGAPLLWTISSSILCLWRACRSFFVLAAACSSFLAMTGYGRSRIGAQRLHRVRQAEGDKLPRRRAGKRRWYRNPVTLQPSPNN